MSRVLAEVAGKIATLLGYDGTDFRNVHVDAAGDLQVDVLTTAMDALAATEATLATRASEAKLELCRLLLLDVGNSNTANWAALVSILGELELKANLTETQPVSAASLPLPTGASTSANQTTMITALQLIDDLRNALDSVGTDELDVNVEASVLPPLAATSTWQDTLNETLLSLRDNMPTGDKWKRASGTINLIPNTWTDVAIVTVPAGKIHYWMGVTGGPILTNDLFAVKLIEGVTTIIEYYVGSNPLVVNIGQLSRRTAAETYKVQMQQFTAGNIWMGCMVTYIEVDA